MDYLRYFGLSTVLTFSHVQVMKYLACAALIFVTRSFVSVELIATSVKSTIRLAVFVVETFRNGQVLQFILANSRGLHES